MPRSCNEGSPPVNESFFFHFSANSLHKTLVFESKLSNLRAQFCLCTLLFLEWWVPTGSRNPPVQGEGTTRGLGRTRSGCSLLESVAWYPVYRAGWGPGGMRLISSRSVCATGCQGMEGGPTVHPTQDSAVSSTFTTIKDQSITFH